MTRRFLDTSFLLALAFISDEHHEAAVRLHCSAPLNYVTTEYVLMEFLDATSGLRTRRVGLSAVAALRADPQVEVVPASTALMEEGMRLYQERPDKEWGATDCVSFVVMRRHGLTDALTADHHFEQAGFRALLRSPS